MSAIRVKHEGSIIRLYLCASERHNAFDPEMIRELTDFFQNVETQHQQVRVIHLSGEGPSFCAGADLKWMKSMAQASREENARDAEKLFEMFEVARQCRIPIVAKLHGNVMGGGLGLVAVADVIAALRETVFCFTETRLGLVPSVISPFVLRKVPKGFARQMMMTAETFGSERALQVGLIHFLGEAEEVDDFVQGQIDFLIGNGPQALRTLKELLNFQETSSWSEIKQETIRVISERRVSPEGQEGLSAFFEKRKPSWKI